MASSGILVLARAVSYQIALLDTPWIHVLPSLSNFGPQGLVYLILRLLERGGFYRSQDLMVTGVIGFP